MRILLYILLFVICISCGQQQVADEKPTIPTEPEYMGTGKLVPINFSDTTYTDLQAWVKDTVTPLGWAIKYLIKDDKTRYSDIHIEWSKGNRKGYYKAEGVLGLRRYFIPTYAAENKQGIFFTHGCATDCSALLVLSKDTMGGFNDYTHVVEYDIPLGQIAYLTEKTYSDTLYEIGLVDLNRHRQHTVLFEGNTTAVIKEPAIERIDFMSNKIVITANLYKDTVRQKEVRTILLDK